MVTRDEVMAALGQVMDPEIHRPITDLDMVKD
ncbi:MAG TPA: iron-sulfur cluster assembly protein, partial [Actinomycetota bacterium]|nr:iron-sulfur cluster assembly protein [Actinomycetota bacterium]